MPRFCAMIGDAQVGRLYCAQDLEDHPRGVPARPAAPLAKGRDQR